MEIDRNLHAACVRMQLKASNAMKKILPFGNVRDETPLLFLLHSEKQY